MKKIVLLVVLSLVCVSVFGGGLKEPKEFDPTTTPFEGQWNTINIKGELIYTYTFFGNRWEYIEKKINNDDNDVYLTGLFNYNDKQILFSNEKGKWTRGYEFHGSYEFYLDKSYGRDQTNIYGGFTKQPYGDLVNSYYTKEKLFSDIVTNENELDVIQGTWGDKQAAYTFSGEQFTVTAQGKRPVTGTVKIANNILYLIISDKQYGIFYLKRSYYTIFLNTLWGHGDLWWGYFIKQISFSDIVTNENELASIQGSWKHTNPQARGATYTFSGDQFTFTRTDGSKPISGTVKIANNILYLIISDEQYGIFYLDLSNNYIALTERLGYKDLSWGPFIKQ